MKRPSCSVSVDSLGLDKTLDAVAHPDIEYIAPAFLPERFFFEKPLEN